MWYTLKAPSVRVQAHSRHCLINKKKGLIGVFKIKLYTNIIITFVNIGGWLFQFIIAT